MNDGISLQTLCAHNACSGIFALFGILNLESLTQKQSTCCHASSSSILKRTHTNEISESFLIIIPYCLQKKQFPTQEMVKFTQAGM